LEFSPDEKQLVYLAEKKEPKKQSFLQFGLTSPVDGVKMVAVLIALTISKQFFK